MKRKLLFLVSLLSTSMVLTACGGTGEGSGITLPNTAEEAVNMFYQFATTNGIEITYRVYDDESQQPELNTIGFKNDVFWVKEDVAYNQIDADAEGARRRYSASHRPSYRPSYRPSCSSDFSYWRRYEDTGRNNGLDGFKASS